MVLHRHGNTCGLEEASLPPAAAALKSWWALSRSEVAGEAERVCCSAADTYNVCVFEKVSITAWREFHLVKRCGRFIPDAKKQTNLQPLQPPCC